MHKQVLAEGFDIFATLIEEVQGGWAAAAYRVHEGNREYFLKVYDKGRPSITQWTERIDDYIPALVWLSEHTELRGCVPRPVRSREGGHRVEDGKGIYLVFPYIEGETIGKRPLSRPQTVELATMIAELHRHGDNLPFPTKGVSEDISLSFCKKLIVYLDNIGDSEAALRDFLATHEAIVRAAVNITVGLRDEVREGSRNLVLCHTDAHNWNLIQSDRLMLIDWEGLRLAPPEADLFMFEEHEYFDVFMDTYRTIHPDFRMDEPMLMFYLFRRRMEDIWDFIAQLLYDQPDRATVDSIYRHLLRECEGTKRLLERWGATK